MRFVRMLCLVVTLFVTAYAGARAQTTAAGAPEHPCTPAQVREYMQLVGAIQKAHHLMQLMIDTAQKTANPAIPAAMWKDMSDAIMKIDIASAAVPAYQKYVSEEDMASAISFEKSPAGQRLLAASPSVEEALAATMRSEGFRIGKQIGEKYADQIAAKQKEIDAAAAARSGKPAEPPIQLKQEPK